MLELRLNACFTSEARLHRHASIEELDALERDSSPNAFVFDERDFAHAATPEQLLLVIAARVAGAVKRGGSGRERWQSR